MGGVQELGSELSHAVVRHKLPHIQFAGRSLLLTSSSSFVRPLWCCWAAVTSEGQSEPGAGTVTQHTYRTAWEGSEEGEHIIEVNLLYST